PTTMDECVGLITGVTSNDLTYTEAGTHEITWVFDDGNGNLTEATQEVVVTDSTAPEVPVLQDAFVQCSAAVSTPITFDGCMGEILGTTSDPVAYSASGTYEITWTFDDGNGNAIDVNQNIVVEDTEAPSLTCPDDITVTVNDSDPIYLVQGNEFDLLFAEDNCGVDELENDFNLSSTLDQAAFEVGTTTINWVVSDYSGNSNTCSTEVTVESIVSVGELTDDLDLNIFPNPNTGKFSLDFVSATKGEVNVTILNYEGRMVYSETFDKDSEDFSKDINIEQMATGVYLVCVYTDNFSAKRRVSITNGNNE
ncbi:MAG: T9SS type A sorting domain-containing protein, partial [Flavobacteriales bacterium]